MKSLTTLLLTACTTLTSALALPTSVAAPLPAKFTLKFTSAPGTAVSGFPDQVVIGAVYGQLLELGTWNKMAKPIELYTVPPTSAYVVNTIAGLGDWYLTMTTSGPVRLVGPQSWGWDMPKTGFSVVDGELVWDAADGSGPQKKWAACRDGTAWDLWSVYWGTNYGYECVDIKLHVVAL